jgi:hypothetical protein
MKACMKKLVLAGGVLALGVGGCSAPRVQSVSDASAQQSVGSFALSASDGLGHAVFTTRKAMLSRGYSREQVDQALASVPTN